MKILAFTNLYPNPYQPHRGTFNRQQFCALSRRHEVRVVSPIAWTDELVLRYRRGRALGSARREQVDGLTVDYPRYYFPPKILRRSYGACLLSSVRQTMESVVEEFRPDLIYAAWVYPDGWAAVRLGKRFGLPVVVKAHGSDVLQLAKVPQRRKGTISALRGADAVFCVSRDLADKVAQHNVQPERIHIVYDGVDRTRFFPGDRAEARRRLELPESRNILFVGNLVPVKSVETLIEACGRLKAQGSPVHCRIVGDGPLRSSLQADIDARGLSDWVKLVGPISHRDLGDWFRAADAFVLPSRSEGLPCVLLEAAACGTPFVASRVGGIPEIARETSSLLTTPGDAAELATSIDRILQSPPSVERNDMAILRGLDETAAEISTLFDGVLARCSAAGKRT